jgi:squalene synthase HpnC
MQSSLAASDAASGWAALPPEYAIPTNPPSLEEARAYCERLAKKHYENFSVATCFLPQKLRPHFYSIYAYCRISDDLGDEVADPLQSLALLDEWERELDACYAGSPRHPVFVALRPTILDCEIPRDPFANLLAAFRQDQTVTRYNTFEDLLAYCVNSANPVGRLVLYACGYADAERQQLSDFTCTALQLANFWQDVVVDSGKGRIYLPLDDLKHHGVSEADIAARHFSPMFRELMRFEVERARQWFASGRPLLRSVDRELAIDIELFSRGGEEILNCIERQDYDVLRGRPVISKPRKLALVASTAMKALWNRL